MPDPRIHVGATYGPFEGRVDPDAAMAYALATNDPNPVYLDGKAVPPLYTVSLVLPALHEATRNAVDPGAIRNVRGGVHAEHDTYVRRPVLPGAEVRWTADTYCAKPTPAGVLVSQRLHVTDSGGAVLVEHFWSTLYIGGEIDGPLGPDLADHTFPPDARSQPLGSHTFDVSGDQSFRYAGASTDHAPMHIDDRAAQRVGFPGKFIQGLCTFAMCSGAVVKWAAGGDPTRVRRLAGRFASPVFPRTQLVVDVYEAGTAPDGALVVAFEATSAGVTVVKHGRADLVP
jgi:acyl dehydratase